MNRKLLYIIIVSVVPAFGIARLLQANEVGLPTGPPQVKDTMGLTIPSDPANLPFKMIAGVPEYVIGTDDQLEITTRKGSVETVEKVLVRPDGKISFSFLYGIQAAGLTPSELTRSLTQGLARYIRTPYLEIKVSDFRSKHVVILGAIGSVATSLTGTRLGPGIYPLKGFTTVLSQILEVGGAVPGARLSEVQLTRGGKVYTLNLQQVLTTGDKRQDVVLENGDALFVRGPGQGQGLVFVLGEVAQPGVKPLERPFLLDVLTSAGGFTASAMEGQVHVIRPGKNPYHPTVFSVNAGKLYRGDFTQNLRLEDGDVVSVSKDALADITRVLGQIGPVLQALTLPATVVSAYTTAFGILPVLRAQNILQGQSLNLLGGGTTGIPGTTGTTGGTGGITIPSFISPKPVVPEEQK